MSEPGKRAGLGVIFLTVFMDLVGFSIIFPLLPSMLEHYLAQEGSESLIGSFVAFLERASSAAGATEGNSAFLTTVLFGGVLGSLYALLQFFFAPLWGRISDRVGRRRILMITTLGTSVAYVVWVFAGSFVLLVLSRFVGGVMGGNISVANAAVADVTTAETRAKGMGMLGAAFGLGFILGPSLGGGLSLLDLRTVLDLPGINPFSAPALGAFVLALINFVWIVRKFEETLDDEHRGQARNDRRPYNPFAAMTRIDLPGVNRINLVFFIYTLAFTGMEFTLTFLARDRFDYSAAKNALLFIYVGFIIAAVQGGVVRKVAPRYGERKVSMAGLLLIVPGLAIVGQSTSELAMYFGLGMLSFGSALTTPSLTALVSLYTPGGRQGEVLGVFRSLGSLARAIGPIIACFVYWRFGSGWPYTGAAVLILVPIALSFALPAAPRPAVEAEVP
jgi:MFS family permease